MQVGKMSAACDRTTITNLDGSCTYVAIYHILRKTPLWPLVNQELQASILVALKYQKFDMTGQFCPMPPPAIRETYARYAEKRLGEGGATPWAFIEAIYANSPKMKTELFTYVYNLIPVVTKASQTQFNLQITALYSGRLPARPFAWSRCALHLWNRSTPYVADKQHGPDQIRMLVRYLTDFAANLRIIAGTVEYAWGDPVGSEKGHLVAFVRCENEVHFFNWGEVKTGAEMCAEGPERFLSPGDKPFCVTDLTFLWSGNSEHVPFDCRFTLEPKEQLMLLHAMRSLNGDQCNAKQTRLIQWYVQNLPEWYRAQLPTKWTGPFNTHWREAAFNGNAAEDEDMHDPAVDDPLTWTEDVRASAVGHAVHIARIILTEAFITQSPEDAMGLSADKLIAPMLVYAAQNGDATLVEMLCAEVDRGGRDDVREFVNRLAGPLPALSVAAQAGHLQVVELLLSKGADPLWAENCCQAFARDGHDGTITELPAGYVDVNRCSECEGDRRGSTARVKAARAGHYDIVGLLEGAVLFEEPGAGHKRAKLQSGWIDPTLP